MFLNRFTSRVRQLEAEQAKENRRDIARSLNQGQITKRDLIKWGLLSASGTIACKNGLSPFARSAYASVPTGTPRSPVSHIPRFSQALPMPYAAEPLPLAPTTVFNPVTGSNETAYSFLNPNTRLDTGLLPARRTSYHSLYNYLRETGGDATPYTNPVTNEGPIEGRPPFYDSGDGKKKEFFAHQRWGEFAPKVGYSLSMGQIEAGHNVHPNLNHLGANAMWSCGPRYGHTFAASSAPGGLDPSQREGYYGYRTGYCNPPLVKMRYGEPVIMRINNDLPVDRHLNNGFGRNEISTHNHNAHNAAESDGACNAFHFPGTFYDYHWSAVLARHDACTDPNSLIARKMRTDPGFRAGHASASTIDDNGNPVLVPGDYREIQSSLWFHDHRFFFTAENVQKGMYGLINMYSGPDNGNETLTHAGALRLPSGSNKAWGNQDYDINLAITNPALDRDHQLTYDIFDTDGYLGDLLCVNGAFSPFLEVKERRYRFRLLNASMARFLQLALVDQAGKPLPFLVIANDGNLLPKPVLISTGITDQMGNAERLDIVVDFKRLKQAGVTRAYLVNLLYHEDGRMPEGRVSIGQAMQGFPADPAVGPFLEFRLAGEAVDNSADLFQAAYTNVRGTSFLTRQIPVQAPVRERHFRFGRGDNTITARDPVTNDCTPDCGEAEKFPWAIKVNGQEWHAFNATRISALVPAMGDVEHWTFENNSGGWDHPVHLHFEEGVTINRGGNSIPATERGARKDVWRLRPNGTVKIQVRFSEFAGAYVQHCHNTTHEDFSMIMRVQLLGYDKGQPQYEISPTPLPTPQGIQWGSSDVLPEARPNFGSNNPI